MNITKIKLVWFSPENIKKKSFGKVTDHRTLDVRSSKTSKPKPKIGGIFDPHIFGYGNYECFCGKLRGKKYKGRKCENEKCGTEINEKSIQRWRMGHIELSSPVTNAVIFKPLSFTLSKLLKISSKDLEDIIYFQKYVVIDNGLSTFLKKNQVLEKKIDLDLISNILQEIIDNKEAKKEIISEAEQLKNELKEESTIFLEDYLSFLEKNWQVKVSIGTEAFEELLKNFNVEEELKKLQSNNNEEKQKKTVQEKIRFLKNIQKSGIRLEWMIIKNLPVIPSGLRPITRLKELDKVVSTQTNNTYQKVMLADKMLENSLNTNKNFKAFPSTVIHEQKLRLQKVVDQTLYGSSHQKQGEIKSLLQCLSGKEGILRRYSLGKRTNYSARSVIVPNPYLLLDEIGIPVEMALSLYEPFIIQKILKERMAFTIKEAKQLILHKDPTVFSFLNKIVKDHPLLANRAPSLHRLSIQGFYPKLTLGNSIGLHPLITTALNADFDGDQIAIHLPLTKKSIEETRNYVLSLHHIIDPKNGQLIDIPNQDMILGIYYLTRERKNQDIAFYDEIDNIFKSHWQGNLDLQDLVMIPSKLVGRQFTNSKNNFLFTTLGKLMFNQILPSTFPFYINDLKKYNEEDYWEELATISEIDVKWKNYQPLSGWKKKDIVTFLNKLVKKTPQKDMTEFLDKLKDISFWSVTYSGISISPFELEEVNKKEIIEKNKQKISKIEDHYTQGFYAQKEYKQKKITIWEECKESIQLSLLENLKKRSDTSFYQIWDSGARASSENLTQLFAMRGFTTNYLGEIIEIPITSSLWEGLSPHEFFVSVFGAIKGVTDLSLKTAIAGDFTRRLVEAAQGIIIRLADCGTNSGLEINEDDLNIFLQRVHGRCLAKDVRNEKNEVILDQNIVLLEKEIKTIWENNIRSIWVRSILTCQYDSTNGLCQKCYGLDLSSPEKLVSLGTSVGVIAAQSIGEPGTQLTMRTFHTGGISGNEDITQGLPNIKNIFDPTKVKDEDKAILAKVDGKIKNVENGKVEQEKENKIYSFSKDKTIRVNLGDQVKKGDKITTGKVVLEEYLEIVGREQCQSYIIKEVKKVYNEQGIDINEKHIELFARQMLSKVEIKSKGDSDYLVGDIIGYLQVQKINQSLINENKKPIIFKNIILGLKDLASRSDSFLAGISFQNTLKSLISYSLYRPVDYLQGNKENLITGQLIPTGTGWNEKKKQ